LPTAVITGPTGGLVGEALTFSGAGSSDRDGRIVSYTWDLGDGTPGGGITVTHSYSATGSYTVTLTVTDDGGLSDSAAQNVQVTEPVTNLLPTAVITDRDPQLQCDGQLHSDPHRNRRWWFK